MSVERRITTGIDVPRVESGHYYRCVAVTILGDEGTAEFVEVESPAEARAAERERIRAAVEALPAHEFIDTYEPGTLWRAVDLGAVLAIVREQGE